MNDSIQVLSNQIQIKEWAGQRVVTFEDIDTVHQRARGTASRNFRENRDKFIEGTDYFIINQPDEIRRLGIVRPQGGTADKVTLVTESGYLMVVKSLHDDLAWQVQRLLVNCYFRVKEEMQSIIGARARIPRLTLTVWRCARLWEFPKTILTCGRADTMKKVLEACIDQVLEFDSPDEAVAFVDDLRQRKQRFNVSSRKEVNGKMRIRIQRAYNGNRLLTN